MIPSPCFGKQTSFEVFEPPEQFHSGRTERQSDEHPIPSVMLPSSQVSGGDLLEFPQMSH